jgi:hypothetical protein
VRKLLAAILVVTWIAPASAGPITRDAARCATEAGQAASGTPKKNRYLYPSLALIGGGAAVALVGFLHKTSHPIDPVFLTPEMLAANPYLTDTLLLSMAAGHRNTALGVGGLGIAGAGAALFVVGEKRKHAVPSVSFRAGTVMVTHAFRF